jgi:hypothetical protein
MLGTYSLERINVLVVDGNWHMRKLIGTMLQGFGIQNVEFATDGREAGVSAIVAKPVSAKVVFGRIVQLIENPRQFIRSPSFRGPDRRNRDLSLDPLAQQRRVSDGNESVA